MEKNKIAIIAVAAAAIIVIVAAAMFFSGNDNGGNDKQEKDMVSCATIFQNDYNGVFGPLTVQDGSTASAAAVSKKNDSERLQYSIITWQKRSDAAAEYQKLSESIKAKSGMMGAVPVQLDVSGFENITAVKFDVVMGTMTKFTLLYFAAYKDNILIQSNEYALYDAGNLASDADLTALFSSVGKTIGISNVTVRSPQ